MRRTWSLLGFSGFWLLSLPSAQAVICKVINAKSPDITCRGCLTAQVSCDGKTGYVGMDAIPENKRNHGDEFTNSNELTLYKGAASPFEGMNSVVAIFPADTDKGPRNCHAIGGFSFITASIKNDKGEPCKVKLCGAAVECFENNAILREVLTCLPSENADTCRPLTECMKTALPKEDSGFVDPNYNKIRNGEKAGTAYDHLYLTKGTQKGCNNFTLCTADMIWTVEKPAINGERQNAVIPAYSYGACTHDSQKFGETAKGCPADAQACADDTKKIKFATAKMAIETKAAASGGDAGSKVNK